MCRCICFKILKTDGRCRGLPGTTEFIDSSGQWDDSFFYTNFEVSRLVRGITRLAYRAVSVAWLSDLVSGPSSRSSKLTPSFSSDRRIRGDRSGTYGLWSGWIAAQASGCTDGEMARCASWLSPTSSTLPRQALRFSADLCCIFVACNIPTSLHVLASALMCAIRPDACRCQVLRLPEVPYWHQTLVQRPPSLGARREE